MRLITLFTYQDLQTATLAKMRLESEGIDSYIQSSEMLRMTGLINALGGVKLQVRDNVIEKASKVINEFNQEVGIQENNT